MPDRTQEIKNLKAVAVACKNYIDKRIDDLQWQLGTYDLSVDTNTNTAHIKQLPSGTIQTTVTKVEGVGYKVNQLINKDNLPATQTISDVTITNNADGSLSLSGTASADISLNLVAYTIKANSKYLLCGAKGGSANAKLYAYGSGVSFSDTGSGVIVSNTSETYIVIRLVIANGTNVNGLKFIPMLFDLTADFGAGNEPSTVSDCATAYLPRGIDIYSYTPQQSSIKNNEFTGVKVEGQNLLNLPDVTQTTRVGIIYKVENGLVTINGTVDSGAYPQLFGSNGLNVYLEKGTYTIFRTVFSSLYMWLGNNETPNGIVNTSSGSYTFTINESGTYKFNLVGTSGSQFTNYQTYVTIARGTNTIPYVPYIQPTTISVDLTQIKDSNNVSLFPNGKMMGNSSVADFITPYNQESRWAEYTFTGNESVSARTVAEGYNGYTINEVLDYKVHTTNFISNLGLESRTNVYSISGIELDTNKMYITFPTSQGIDTTAKCIAFLTGKTMQYERATYLTSNTDLSQLTRIDCESNGTVTLNNTQNVDMPNSIDYLIEEVKA